MRSEPAFHSRAGLTLCLLGVPALFHAGLAAAHGTPPSAPTGLETSPASATRATLSWTAAVPGSLPILSYRVYRGTSASNLTQLTVTLNTSYTDTSATAGATLYYGVEAYDAGGNLSPMSTVVTAVMPMPPAAPGGLTASQTSATMAGLTWSAAAQRTADCSLPGIPWQFARQSQSDWCSPADLLYRQIRDTGGQLLLCGAGQGLGWGSFPDVGGGDAHGAHAAIGARRRVGKRNFSRLCERDMGCRGEWRFADPILLRLPGQFAFRAHSNRYGNTNLLHGQFFNGGKYLLLRCGGQRYGRGYFAHVEYKYGADIEPAFTPGWPDGDSKLERRGGCCASLLQRQPVLERRSQQRLAHPVLPGVPGKFAFQPQPDRRRRTDRLHRQCGDREHGLLLRRDCRRYRRRPFADVRQYSSNHPGRSHRGRLQHPADDYL